MTTHPVHGDAGERSGGVRAARRSDRVGRAGGSRRTARDLPRLRRRQRAAEDRRQRLHQGGAARVQVQLRDQPGRVPAADPDLPRQVVRRLQRGLHADAPDQRQVLHRGRELGRRRVVRRRRPRSRASRRSCATISTAASPTRSSAARTRSRPRSSSRRSRRTWSGLEHTTSDADLLYPTICKNCDGFENVDNAVTGDRCNRHDAELVHHDAGAPRHLAGRPQAVGVRLQERRRRAGGADHGAGERGTWSRHELHGARRRPWAIARSARSRSTSCRRCCTPSR